MAVITVTNPKEVEKAALSKTLLEFFSPREDVESIHVVQEVAGHHYRVILVTTHQHYEDQVMDGLLEIEYKLLDTLADLSVEVDYLPRLERNLAEIIPPTATQIYGK